MPDLVIDEWLWAVLLGDNGAERMGQAVNFLQAMFKKCDRIVTVRGSQFHLKSNRLWKGDSVAQRKLAIWYQNTFAYNANKTLMVEEDELPPLSAAIALDVKQPDQYMLRAHIHTNAQLLVTTDGPLMEACKKHQIAHDSRERFVPDYIALHLGNG